MCNNGAYYIAMYVYMYVDKFGRYICIVLKNIEIGYIHSYIHNHIHTFSSCKKLSCILHAQLSYYVIAI